MQLRAPMAPSWRNASQIHKRRSHRFARSVSGLDICDGHQKCVLVGAAGNFVASATIQFLNQMLGSAFQFLERVIALNRLEKVTASAATAQVSRKAASTVSGSGSPKKMKITR